MNRILWFVLGAVVMFAGQSLAEGLFEPYREDRRDTRATGGLFEKTQDYRDQRSNSGQLFDRQYSGQRNPC